MTFCAGTYKDSVFSCALVRVQLLVMVKNYNMPSFIAITKVWTWSIPQKLSNFQESGIQKIQGLPYSDWRWHMFLQEEDLVEQFDLASPP